jgi:hypothetical protein
MSTNPYAPPKAAVADVAAVNDEPIFFPVSRTKLIVMLVVTLTLYQLVWFYKNWALARRRGEPVLPLLRAVFAVFFCYSLFDRVRSRAAPAGVRLPAGLLATAWIVLTLVGNVFDRVVSPEEFPAAFLISLVLLFAAASVLVPVQHAVNTINRVEVPDHDPNDRFTAANWLWIVVGGLFVALATLGSLVTAA